MKILVCVSITPDTTTNIQFENNNTTFKSDGVQYILNPYDEWYSLVRAVEIKEANPDTKIHIVHVGPQKHETVIKKALAIGGDEAFRIDFEPEDSFSVAHSIADFVKEQDPYDIIFTGKESIDYNSGMVGGILAELLSVPFFANISNLELSKDNTLKIKQEIEGGYKVIEGKTPVVFASQKGLAEQRIPNMKGIISSRSKKINVISPKELKVKNKIQSFEMPPPKTEVKLVDPDNVEELVKLLHEEAKVI